MATSREILKIVGLAGLALLIGQGCSQKSVRVTSDAETFEQGTQYAENQADAQYGENSTDSQNAGNQTGDQNQFVEGYQPFGSGDTGGEQRVGSSQGQWQDGQESQGYQPQGPAQAYIDGVAQGEAGAQAGEGGDQNASQDGLSYFGNNQNSSEPWANSGPLAGLQEYGREWNQGQGSALANEFIQEDYDNIAEAQPFSQNEFAQGGRYGQDSPYFAQGQGAQGGQYGRVQVELQDVFFEFNSWRISQEGTQALAHDAEWLEQKGARSITVEGHCDQRGTRDYNLVLGKKRAQAVQTYLVDLGVEARKIHVISYGKERPFCFGNDEQCYQLNRRGHLQLHH